jgi:hypothetical protein
MRHEHAADEFSTLEDGIHEGLVRLLKIVRRGLANLIPLTDFSIRLTRRIFFLQRSGFHVNLM